ncbi:hypothetical protein FQZ97_577000 [compost metagenome]
MLRGFRRRFAGGLLGGLLFLEGAQFGAQQAGPRLEQAQHDDEEGRHENHRERRGGQHAAQHAQAHRLLAGGARAGCHCQRDHAQDERQRGHQDRTEPQPRGLHRGLEQAHAAGVLVLGEFHDQDGVLGRQADHGHHAHLEVHVVGHAQRTDQRHGAQHAQRHHQHHRDRDRPAFIQGGQHQEHNQQRQAHQDGSLIAGLAFLVGKAVPFVAEALGQLPDQTFHFSHGLAGGVARRRVAADAHGLVAVVAHHLHRALLPLGLHEGGQRHHAALAVARVQLQHVAELHAVRRVGLHPDILHPAQVGELAQVSRADRRGDQRGGLVEVHAQRRGLVAIDGQAELRALAEAGDPHLRQHGALHGHAHQLGGGRRQRLGTGRPAILQAEVETGGVAQRGDGGRHQGEHLRVVDAHQLLLEGVERDRPRGILALLAFAEILQRDERDGGVQAVAVEAIALHGDHVLDRRHAREVLLDLFDDVDGAVRRGARGQFDVADHVALVFLGQERRRQAQVQPAQQQDQQQEHQHHAAALVQDARHPVLVTVGGGVELAVEPAEEALLLVVMPLGHRLEDGGAQRRREGQRQQGREEDRHGHGHGELAVDHAHRTAHEGQRQEHGHQHQRNTDDGAADLRHGLLGGFLGRQPFGRHDPLDVLDHHDGVVHQDPDGQHHGEHGQHVDGEAERQHHRERPQHGHRHHQRRDQGVPDVLQEQIHHQEHQDHGLDQGMDHLFDGHLHVGRGVVRNGVGDVAREVLGQLLHLLAHALRGRQRVRVRRQHDGEGRRRLAVQAGAELVVVRADFDASDVAQQHLGAVGIGAQDDLAEALDRAQLAVGRDRGGDALRIRVGRRADAAAGNHHVLVGDRLVDLRHTQVEAHQLGWVHPDAHGARRGEQLELAYAGHARHRVLDIAGDVVGQRGLV